MKHYLSIADVRKDIEGGTLRLSELVQHYLGNIGSRSNINAFLEVWPEEALEKAEEVQKKIEEGKAGKLAGAVLGIKDNLCYKGHRSSASSKILEGFESVYTATAVQKLLDEDAIIIGRCNSDEFAMGSSNENSAYGPVKNPLDESRVPGGSSGGSAAAVAADMCIAALGSDTGGSVRQPASFCGVLGLKPSYGRISRYGLIAYASSFDQIGPLTHSAADARLLLSIMAGRDAHDSTSSINTNTEYLPEERKGLKIAVLSECLEAPGLSDTVKKGMLKTIEDLESAGHTIEHVSFPYLEFIIPAYYVLTTAEASSNLARFDGIHYGYRSEKATDIESTYVFSRSEGFGEEVKRRIMLGTFVLSAGYYDAYYSKAQKVRRIVKEHIDKILADHDLIMLPCTPTSAFGLAAVKDPIAMYLQDIFTVQANMVGLPAISIPLLKDHDQMPVGLQFIAPKFEECVLLDMAESLMKGELTKA